MKRLLLAAALLPALACPALADLWCSDHGVQCYRPPVQEPALFLDNFMSPKGDYVGSLYMQDGLCAECPFSDCKPCREEYASLDFGKLCNETYPECDGNCFPEY